MKYARQFLIILAVTFAGELLHYVIPLPVPASIYGFLLLLLLLCCGALKLDQIRESAAFLLGWLPLMLVAPVVSVIGAWTQLQPILLPVLVITFVSTAATIIATGRAAQGIIRLEKRGRK